MELKKKLGWVTLFSIAMGFLETAVVIYLRQLYYPAGFNFPLLPMPHNIAMVELWREAATVVMLLGVGVLAGNCRSERFAWFIYSFAIWDIFYYIFLYVFIDWPQSLYTWDILFLIPVPWVGPVLAPVVVALTMILFALSIVWLKARGKAVAVSRQEGLLLSGGSLVAIYSFTKDYIHQHGLSIYNAASDGAVFSNLDTYVPLHFSWVIFVAGEAMLLLAWILYWGRIKRTTTGGVALG